MARITVVDDDVELAENIAALLGGHKHEVNTLFETAGAQEAILRDLPDLLILDVMFPDDATAGFTLARELRRSAKTRELPIILLTGINQNFPVEFTDDDIDPSWMPVQRFLEKPFDMDDLVRTVADLIGQTGARDAGPPRGVP